MYVDNLVRSINAVVAHPEQVSGFYNVADDGTTTWREYYGALAAGLGVEMATIGTVPGDRYRAGLSGLLEEIKNHLPPYQWLKHGLSSETKNAIKLRLKRALSRDPPPQWNGGPQPVVTRDMWHLQTTRNPLPTAKFRATFGHRDLTSFASGLAASLAWVRFIGLDEREAVRGAVAGAAGAAALAAARQ